MSLQWLAVAALILVASATWAHARRTAKRLARLEETCWELRYQYSELRAELRRLTDNAEPPPSGDADAPASPTAGFVPITSLKR